MSGTTYYWQGGRKIEIEQAGNFATVEADSVEEIEKAAEKADVRVLRAQLVTPGVVKLELPDDRDGSMERLRVTHVVSCLSYQGTARRRDFDYRNGIH